MAKKLWIIVFLLAPTVALAHPGNTDGRGGHVCKTNCEKYSLSYGQYHFHPEWMDTKTRARYDAFHDRLCARVAKRFSGNATAFGRVNTRIHKAFGFDCTMSIASPRAVPEVQRSLRSDGSKSAEGATVQSAKVMRVIDGDTIEVRIKDGPSERVRFIGIDTPELGQGKTLNECYAAEASLHLKQLLGGANVQLIVRAGDNRDKYGRLLRYVELNGTDIGLQMLEEGYAKNYPWFNHPRTQQYTTAEDNAKQQMMGLWKECSS